MSFLRDLGYGRVQGYLLGHPSPEPDLVDLLKNGLDLFDSKPGLTSVK